MSSSASSQKMLYLDWDCTLTVNHMYHLLRPLRKSHNETSMWGSIGVKEKDRVQKDKGFKHVVARLHEQYALWGRKDNEAFQELQELTRSSQPLIDREDEYESLIYDHLQVHLFGDENRRRTLDGFIVSMSAKCRGVCILTKGLAGCVYSAILSYFDHWLQLPNLKIVDYAGQVMEFSNGKASMKLSYLNARVKPKLSQVCEMEFSSNADKERTCALIDDSFEEEIDRVYLTSPALKKPKFTFYNVDLPLADGSRVLHLGLGGTLRNGDGLTVQDFTYLEQTILGC